MYVLICLFIPFSAEITLSALPTGTNGSMIVSKSRAANLLQLCTVSKC